MAKFFQVAIRGHKPCGGLFLDAEKAQLEIDILMAEDAAANMPPTEYEIVEVEINLWPNRLLGIPHVVYHN